MSSRPYIFTFYSYKGGVGRSMALLNVAYALAGRGRHVLIIDLDLEAPGISGFLERNDELDPPLGKGDRDVVDLLREVSTLEDTGRARIEGFIRPIQRRKLEPLAPKFGELGRLDVVCADQGRDYWRRLSSLGLGSYTSEKLLQLSAKLWSYLKAQRFGFSPLGLEDEPPSDTAYDYVLVDSRTGITETGGLCIGPLADRLVVVTGLNDQNVWGTQEFLRVAGIEPNRRTEQAQAWDDADDVADAERREKSLGPKPTLIVASPIPPGEISFKEQRLAEIGELIGPVAARLSYHPQMALMESLFVRDHKAEYLANEYRRLCDGVMAQVGDHYAQLSKQSEEARATELRTKAVVAALRVASAEPRLGEILLAQQLTFSPVKDEEFLALRRLCATLERGSAANRHSLLGRWGVVLSQQAKTKTGREADRLFELCYQKLAEAQQLKPDQPSLLSNWSAVLIDQAKSKSGPEADRLFELGYEKLDRVLELEPDKYEALKNSAAGLFAQAKTKAGAESDRLFELVYDKLAQALRIAPNESELLYDSGTVLLEQARTKTGAYADRLFELGYEKLDQLLTTEANHHEALNNWGAALAAQAMTKSGPEAQHLFKLSYAKLDQALRIEPRKWGALNNWGAALLAQARTETGPAAEHLFKLGRKKLAEALEIEPDDPETLNNSGLLFSEWATKNTGAKAERLFGLSYEKFAQSLATRPDKHESLYNWAAALSKQAKMKSGVGADRLFELSYQKRTQALRTDPNNHASLNDWALALLEQAKSKRDTEADRLLELAYEKLARAVATSPNNRSSLYNWGLALSNQARTKTSAEADRLSELSYGKMAQILEIEKENHEALSLWGTTLLEQARRKSGAEADRIFGLGYDKLAKALAINPERADSLNNWGVGLVQQAKTKTPVEARSIFASAKEQFTAANRVQAGIASLNLACVAALTGDLKACVASLLEAKDAGKLKNRRQVEEDDDFATVLSDPGVQQLLSGLEK